MISAVLSWFGHNLSADLQGANLCGFTMKKCAVSSNGNYWSQKLHGMTECCYKNTACQNMKILLICAENNHIPDVLYTFETLYLLLCTENNCLTTYFVGKYIVNLASLSPMVYHRWSKWGCNSPGFLKMHCLGSDAVAASLPCY